MEGTQREEDTLQQETDVRPWGDLRSHGDWWLLLTWQVWIQQGGGGKREVWGRSAQHVQELALKFYLGTRWGLWKVEGAAC